MFIKSIVSMLLEEDNVYLSEIVEVTGYKDWQIKGLLDTLLICGMIRTNKGNRYSVHAWTFSVFGELSCRAIPFGHAEPVMPSHTLWSC